MSDHKVSTRFGTKTVKVSETSILVDGVWFRYTIRKGSVTFSHYDHGSFTGHKVSSLKGSAYLFSHNGHRYSGYSPVAAFVRLVASELA